MHEFLMRFMDDMIDRVSGPLHFRLILQPLMVIIYAFFSGWKDARAGNTPYFQELVTDPDARLAMIRDAWQHIGKIFILAILLDVVFQIIVLRYVYVGEAVIVAFTLAIVPYLIFRGLITRLVRRR